ncbi:MAG: TonB-dependent receptor plug domain-containing protein, partial [Verrucomicrobiia bacterium]
MTRSLLVFLGVISAVFPSLAVLPGSPEARLRQPVLTETPVELGAIVVRATAGAPEVFLPDVQGTEIFAGKKTARLSPAETGAGPTNNFRLALSQTPGLFLSEETTPLVSIGGRGFDPHRAQFYQVLKDGIPIHADPFGYPEAYYTPPLSAVQSIELVRGGGSLLYGPQPAGTINFVTYAPRTDRPFHLTTENTFGSYGLFTNYTAVDGTVDRVGYLAYFNHRQADGFRTTNSDYTLHTGTAKMVLTLTPASRLIFNVDATDEEHGEPGGLAPDRAPVTPNTRFYSRDRNIATRTFDRFRLERYAAYAKYQHDLDTDTLLEIATWGG